MFAHEPAEKAAKTWQQCIFDIQGLVLADLFKGHNYNPSSFYATSIAKLKEDKESADIISM